MGYGYGRGQGSSAVNKPLSTANSFLRPPRVEGEDEVRWCVWCRAQQTFPHPTCWHCLLVIAWTAVVPSAFGLLCFTLRRGHGRGVFHFDAIGTHGAVSLSLSLFYTQQCHPSTL